MLLLFSSMYACKPEIKETGAALKYFDLKGFFQADSARLAKAAPLVAKTVTHNGQTQTKKVRIRDWGQEFGLFTSSDINKPAWKDSYTITGNADSTAYTAKFQDLKTRSVVICKTGNKVTSIRIENRVNNLLYNTTEKLLYVPDTYYTIEKDQKVRALGANNYVVKGVFNAGR